MATFHCDACGKDKARQTNGGTGYATHNDGRTICYQCCADIDRADMIATGKATLYLSCEPEHKASYGMRSKLGTVGNWPGTLKLNCHIRKGNHNIAGTRYDCWFVGPDGYQWHGVQYGENTQICHCRRTKTKA